MEYKSYPREKWNRFSKLAKKLIIFVKNFFFLELNLDPRKEKIIIREKKRTTREKYIFSRARKGRVKFLSSLVFLKWFLRERERGFLGNA